MTIQKGTKPASNIKSLLMLLLLVAAIPITVSIFLIQTRYFSKATEYQAQYYFVPVSAVMPPDQEVEIMLNSGAQKVAFVDTQLTFDPAKIQLASEIIPSNVLTTVNRKTSMEDANATGRIELVFSIWPGDATPSGLFSIAKLPFKPVSEIPNDTASLQINSLESQIVDIDSNELIPVSDPYLFTLNNQLTSISPTDNPTSISPTDNPTSISPTDNPATIAPTDNPTTIAPTDTITLTMTPMNTPTATVARDIIPDAPFWFELLPTNLKRFLENLYLLIFVYRRNSNFIDLLNGIVPMPTRAM